MNAYLSRLQAHNENGSLYSLRSLHFNVTPLADLGVMYSVVLVINDAAQDESCHDSIELPF